MAIEKFEERRLTGSLNVKCKMSDGTVRTWSAKKETVVAQIAAIVEDYARQGYRLTLRQLHYQLVGRNWIVNAQEAYKKLGKILDDCRYGGVIDWDSIEDRGRVLKGSYTVEDIPDALNDTIRHYKLNRQRGQENHVEVWTEKDALSAIFTRTTSKYGIDLGINKGYTSTSAIYQAYDRFNDHFRQDKTVTILYFGDHDPSGLDMVRDIRERLAFMLENGDYAGNRYEELLSVKPIGLTMAQIKKYKLPPNPAKLTDSRADKYIEQFGQECWEVDALSPEVLTSIIEANIQAEIDMDQYETILAQEDADRKKLKSFINKK